MVIRGIRLLLSCYPSPDLVWMTLQVQDQKVKRMREGNIYFYRTFLSVFEAYSQIHTYVSMECSL